MEQLIFIGIIVLFSVLEAIGRKQKERQGEMGEEIPLPPPPRPRRAERQPVPRSESAPEGSVPRSYDEDAAFDEAPSFDEKALPAGGAEKGPPTSSEGLIPADVWDEIQRMARGEPLPEPAPRPAPRRETPKPQPVPRGTEAPTPFPAEGKKPGPRDRRPQRAPRAKLPTRTEPRPPAPIRGRAAEKASPAPPLALEEVRPDRAGHARHAELGTAVSGLPSGSLEVEGRRSGEGARLRKLLSGAGARDLRQAIVLSEVLGPPAALRDEAER